MKSRIYVLGGALGVLFIAAVIGLAAYGVRRKNTTDTTIRVVAAENFWGDIVRQIGGDKIKVTSIITDPSADPHLYESNAQDALAIAQANVIITNGLGYDDFMGKLMSASPNAQRSVLTVADVLNVHGSDANPHLWYDISRMPRAAQAFEQALARKDPADAAYFAHNLQTFTSSLRPLTATLNQIQTRFGGAPVAYTERVPGYLLLDAGLSVQSPAGFASAIEEGNDPSPADQSAMNQLISNKKVKALLYNAQATSPITEHVRSLAAQAHIPVVGVTETIPASEHSYQQWQQDQLNQLLQALEQ